MTSAKHSAEGGFLDLALTGGLEEILAAAEGCPGTLISGVRLRVEAMDSDGDGREQRTEDNISRKFGHRRLFERRSHCDHK